MAGVRKATLADAIKVAPRLRQADRDECIATWGMTPEIVLPRSITEGGDVWAMIGDEGEVVGLFGVSPVACHPYFGIVWLVSTDDIYRYRRVILRLAPTWLQRLHDRYPLIGNHIDARNTIHVRWLKRMGFSFLRTLHDQGPERRPFHEFARLRTEPCVQQSSK